MIKFQDGEIWRLQSRYKLALECPTKLFYLGKPKEYEDTSVNDPFLIALARGGFQVGALAQSYYPQGIAIDTLEHEEAIKQTNSLLEKENVTIFEAAIRFENLFVRVDILQKVGNRVRLIEVKSKSYDPREEDQLFDKRLYAKGRIKIRSDYAKYIYDVAFQAHVLKNARPDFAVSSSLMMADKSTVTSVEELNQFFYLSKRDGRTHVETRKGLTLESLGDKILCEVNVDEAVAMS